MEKLKQIPKNLINIIRRILGTQAIIEKITSIENTTQFDQKKYKTHQTIKLAGNTQDVRNTIANTFLSGEGIEIGAFAYPLPIPSNARVKYVDKYDLDAMDASHEIVGLSLQDFGIDINSIIKPDIIDDGECLGKIGDFSQDFVIANHVLEHFENPIKGFKNMLRVLKHDGILYLSLPEMRHSFDSVRQPTPFEHLLRDYEEGPEWSRSSAYVEFAKIFVAHGMDKGLFPRKTGADLAVYEEEVAAELDKANYSIHFHAWTMDGMMNMFSRMKSTFKLSFETRLVVKNNEEVVFIFQKTVPHISSQH